MTFVTDNIEFFFYIFLWSCLLVYYVRRDKCISLGIALISLYTIQAVFALVVYNSPMSDYIGLDMRIWPFFFLFIMFFIALKPILSLKEYAVKSVEVPNNGLNTSLCVFFSVFAIISIINTLPQVETGLQLMMVSDNEGILDLYGESTAAKTTQRSFSGIINIQGVISNMSNYITPLLFFTYYIKEKRSKVVMILLIIALMQGPLTGIANASRLQLIGQTYTFFLLYFFFKPYIKSNDNRILKRGFVIVVAILISVFVTITIARTIQKSYGGNSIYNIESYFAQGPINFNAFCMDANGTREGNRVAPLFLQIMGKETLTPEQIRFKYQRMKIDSSSFSTFVGDFALDFGPYVSLCIFLILSFIFHQLLRHKTRLTYGQIIVVYILLKFCGGFYQFEFCTIGGNLAFVMLLLLSILFLNRYYINSNPEIVKRQPL